MGSGNPSIRPLQRTDLSEFYNEVPRSVRGLAVELDGRTVAVAGVMMNSPLLAFSFLRDELREYPVTIMKTGKKFKEIMAKYKSDIYAEADPEEKNSQAFLTRLGFERIEEEMFVWRNQ